jgi:hypothetical protein
MHAGDEWDTLRKPMGRSKWSRTLRLVAIDDLHHAAIEGARFSVRTLGAWWDEPKQLEPGVYQVPAGRRIVVSCAAEGFTSTRDVLNPETIDEFDRAPIDDSWVKWPLTPQAQLEVHGASGGMCAGLEFEEAEAGELAWQGAAGPAHLRLELSDGRWIHAAIELEPGEQRVLRIAE